MRECGPAPDHRLHNCGPGTREVFRCARVGTDHPVDLLASLAGAAGFDADLRSIRRAVMAGTSAADGERGGAIPRPLVADLAARLLERIGVAPASEPATNDAERAAGLLRQLVGEVVRREWHRPLIGLASDTALSQHEWWAKERLKALPCSLEDVARTVAAYAVYSPPLLLWSRPASLDWLRVDVTLSLRRLYAPGGDA
jgi:hypothetical protein